MKKLSLVAMVLVALGLVLIISASKDVSTYETFAGAEMKGKVVRIAGNLSLDKPIVYDPELDPNVCTFFMKDEELIERPVKLLKAKPQDFERSEKLVLTGKMVDGQFVAHEILMKCPSKYKDEEIQLREG